MDEMSRAVLKVAKKMLREGEKSEIYEEALKAIERAEKADHEETKHLRAAIGRGCPFAIHIGCVEDLDIWEMSNLKGVWVDWTKADRRPVRQRLPRESTEALVQPVGEESYEIVMMTRIEADDDFDRVFTRDKVAEVSTDEDDDDGE